MEDYPCHFADHNVPLLVVSGLGPEPHTEASPPASSSTAAWEAARFENGIIIDSDFPSLSSTLARKTRDALLREDTTAAPWSKNQTTSKNGAVGFRIKHTGRTLVLPPRKAVSLQSIPSSSTSPKASAQFQSNLHSPISPLTPDSPTFPDGIISSHWVTKYQDLVPAAFLSFLPFCTDASMSTTRDDEFIQEVLRLKDVWARSGYRTRVAFALIGDEGELPDNTLERLNYLRKATNSDSNTMYLLRPTAPDEDVIKYARMILDILQVPVLDYYRELAKHARKKRNRGSIPLPTSPPTSGTSQTLSAQGWCVRYDFKLGVFAEFRQNMDMALRSYKSAYEGLFGDEVIEAIAGWSDRFGEARMLADVLAMRLLRCLLCMTQTSTAVHFWGFHRDRIQDILNRRGKGTRNYGWEAWNARWALIMAQLINRSQIPDFEVPGQAVYLPASETSFPWERLHHEGYWINRAIEHVKRRRVLAKRIPNEDRLPPEHGGSARRPSKVALYDTYLVPPPHEEYPLTDHSEKHYCVSLISLHKQSCEHFSLRQQDRMVEQLTLSMAKEYMKLRQWDEALDLLKPLWSTLSWRKDGWWLFMKDFAVCLRRCAINTQDAESVLRVDWEMMNKVFTTLPYPVDLMSSIDELPNHSTKQSLTMSDEKAISCLSANFVFAKAIGNVGEPLACQLVVESMAPAHSSPVTLSDISVHFEGNLGILSLEHQGDSVESNSGDLSEIRDVVLKNGSTSPTYTSSSSFVRTGATSLTFRPSQKRIFNLLHVPRQSGEACLSYISLNVVTDRFSLKYDITRHDPTAAMWWQGTAGFTDKRRPVAKRIGMDRKPFEVQILPRPPKLRIRTPNLLQNYYTDEVVILDVELDNGENEAIDVSLEVRLYGFSETSPRFDWLDPSKNVEGQIQERENMDDVDRDEDGEIHPVLIRRRPMGLIQPGATHSIAALFSNTFSAQKYEVEVAALYTLVSDPDTPIYKTVPIDLSFLRPFEANYEFLPRVHLAPWPDFFHWDDTPDTGTSDGIAKSQQNLGLQQRWCLNVKMVSFALEPLIVEGITVSETVPADGVLCDIGTEHIVQGPYKNQLHPEELRVSEFIIDIQRLSFDERRTTSLDLAMNIRWRRNPTDNQGNQTTTPTTTSAIDPQRLSAIAWSSTSLPVPRFVAPLGEPRVLASVTPSSDTSSVVHLDYTVENPSSHLLSFSITMEPSDNLVFDGPEVMALHLVPLSRHTIRYDISAESNDDGGGMWLQPNLVVFDTYFRKTLVALPTEGMRSDKKGILVWVDGK